MDAGSAFNGLHVGDHLGVTIIQLTGHSSGSQIGVRVSGGGQHLDLEASNAVVVLVKGCQNGVVAHLDILDHERTGADGMLEVVSLLDLKRINAGEILLRNRSKLSEGQQCVGCDSCKADHDLLSVDHNTGKGVVDVTVGVHSALNGLERRQEHGVDDGGLGDVLDAPLDILGSDLLSIVPIGIVAQCEGQRLAILAVLISCQSVGVILNGVQVSVSHYEVCIDRLVIHIGAGIQPGSFEELSGAAIGVDDLLTISAGSRSGAVTAAVSGLTGAARGSSATAARSQSKYHSQTEQQAKRSLQMFFHFVLLVL